jgi:hypothetical protein
MSGTASERQYPRKAGKPLCKREKRPNNLQAQGIIQ